MRLLPAFRRIPGMNGKILIDEGRPVTSGGIVKVWPHDFKLDPGPFSSMLVTIEPFRITSTATFEDLAELRIFRQLPNETVQEILDECGAEDFFAKVKRAVASRLAPVDTDGHGAAEVPGDEPEAVEG